MLRQMVAQRPASMSWREDQHVTFEQICPRCGREFSGDDKDVVADAVVVHANDDHGHNLDREIVLAHLEGVHPHDRED